MATPRKKVVVIGAGFSVPLGLPAMLGFFSRMQETYCKRKSSGLGGHPCDAARHKRVLEMHQNWVDSTNTSNPDDLEEFCSWVSTKHDEGLTYTTNYAIARELDLRKNLEGNKGLQGNWKLYRRFAADLVKNRNRMSAICLNYDLIVDQALLQEGCYPEYHLPVDGTKIREVNEGERTGKPFDLFKIHGSLNWLICNDPNCRTLTLKWQKSGSDSNPDTAGNWPLGNEPSHEHTQEGPLRFLMILPDKCKQPTGQEKWIESVVHAASRALREANEVFFVGYSAPDSDKDVRQLFKDNLPNCERIFVVNKSCTRHLKDRYREIACGIATEYFHGPDGNFENYCGAPWGDLLRGP